MRESNYIFPPQNRAVVSISHMLYDRRALDTSSPLALLNNLTSLTYLTSTSPRIREILASDGGLERLLDLLRDSLLPRTHRTPHDLWGLNGPPTARVISVERSILLKHSLAFQCVVNIGVRGTESIRTRVVQAGALDLVAQILESWLQDKEIAIFAGPFGSQAAVDAFLRGEMMPALDDRRRARSGTSRHVHVQGVPGAGQGRSELPQQITVPTPAGRSNSISQFVANLTRRHGGAEMVDRLLGRTPRAPDNAQLPPPPRTAAMGSAVDDVDMGGDADVEMDTTASIDPDESMEIDDRRAASVDPVPSEPEPELEEPEAGPSTTPRASQLVLPLTMSMPRQALTDSVSDGSTDSFHDAEESTALARTTSENDLGAPASALNSRPELNDVMSTQSSPVGTPVRDTAEPSLSRRRDTIVARPANLNLAPPRPERRERERDGANSEASDVDVDLQMATIHANIRALQAQAVQAAQAQALTGLADTQDGQDADLVLAEDDADEQRDRIAEEEAMAAEQARLDMEAGAPPGQPGAAQTPRVPLQEPTPRMALLGRQPGPGPIPGEPAQIIIAAGAPRGFHDLGAYVGISSMLNPEGDHYSDDAILLALQLLAYLSKYPHVRAAFHHPQRPVHPSLDFSPHEPPPRLPERPSVARTNNIFSLVERYTFRPSPADRIMHRIPSEIQYWAGVIMRNACRKDEAAGGVRQCANMRCGRWEKFAREFAKCRRCRKAKYCSKECQSKAWSEGHRFWCNSRSDHELGPPPDGGMPPPGHDHRGDGGDDDDDDDGSDLHPRGPPHMHVPGQGPPGARHGLHNFQFGAPPPPGAFGGMGMPDGPRRAPAPPGPPGYAFPARPAPAPEGGAREGVQQQTYDTTLQQQAQLAFRQNQHEQQERRRLQHQQMAQQQAQQQAQAQAQAGGEEGPRQGRASRHEDGRHATPTPTPEQMMLLHHQQQVQAQRERQQREYLQAQRARPRLRQETDPGVHAQVRAANRQTLGALPIMPHPPVRPTDLVRAERAEREAREAARREDRAQGDERGDGQGHGTGPGAVASWLHGVPPAGAGAGEGAESGVGAVAEGRGADGEETMDR